MRRTGAFGLALLGVLAGCMGKIEPLPNDEFEDAEVREACKLRTLPVQPLRRLSSRQYANVMRDLFGNELADPLLAGSLFPPTVITRGFRNDAAANTINTAQANAIEDESQRIATTILANPTPWLTTLMPCNADSDAAIDGCIDKFITSFGEHAYRRPITDEEQARARTVYDGVRMTQNATAAWASVVQYFVQAPALLYRVERGGKPGPADGMLALTPHELANRLSFMFLDGAPDPELYAAAQRGELETKAQIAEHARRLMTNPRFAAVLEAFHHDWLHLHELKMKDPTLTGYTPAVRASLERELGEVTRFVFESGGTIADILGASELPVDATLAGYYRVQAPASGWAPAAVPGRRGILTLGSVQAALAGTLISSPLHRGNFFRTEVLCRTPIVLPGNIDIATPLASTAGLPTARQRYAPLTVNPQCKGCHEQFNPIGFAFENFDAVGRWRDTENGVPIDASGTIDLGTPGAPNLVSFANAAELAGALAATEEAQACYAMQWLRATTGRLETEEDKCSVAELKYLVKKHSGDLRELMVALTQIDAFRFRRITE